MSTRARPVTLITGAASGIGAALAVALERRGHRLLLADLDLPALQEQIAARRWPAASVEALRLDVCEAGDWEAGLELALSRWGRLDLLLNVAGVLQPAYVHEITPEQIDRHLAVNVKGVMLGTRAAARLMVRQGAGHIVNIASLAGVAPIPGIALYSASKFAVRGFSLAAALELRPHGVFVSVICPDAVRTPMLDLQAGYPEAAITFSAPRFLGADEVARLIAGRVLRRRPLEVTLPWGRGLLAKLGSLFPALLLPTGRSLRRAGERRRRMFRAE